MQAQQEPQKFSCCAFVQKPFADFDACGARISSECEDLVGHLVSATVLHCLMIDFLIFTLSASVVDQKQVCTRGLGLSVHDIYIISSPLFADISTGIDIVNGKY